MISRAAGRAHKCTHTLARSQVVTHGVRTEGMALVRLPVHTSLLKCNQTSAELRACAQDELHACVQTVPVNKTHWTKRKADQLVIRHEWAVQKHGNTRTAVIKDCYEVRARA
eukprot:6201571-Pleurochrysis_carterae.AAC.4